MMKQYSQVYIDSPGGCCVGSKACVGDKKIKELKGCDLKSCDKNMVSDSDCKKYQDDWEAPYKALNKDLDSRDGVDWEDSKWADKDDHSDLEDYLEGCLFPDKGGKCAASGGKSPKNAPDGPAPAPHSPDQKKPSPAPACADDATWCYGNCNPNNCAYVAAKVRDDGSLPRCRAKFTDANGVSALDACPVTCGTCGQNA